MKKAAIFALAPAVIAISMMSLSRDLRALQQPASGARWRTAWATSQQSLGMNAISNTTVRLIARVTIAGDAVRIRLDNTYGTTPLKIGKAYVGIRARGALLVEGSNHAVRFGGAESISVPPGGTVISDPVTMRV